MASLEEEILQHQFPNERVKANLNLLFTANWLYNILSAMLRPFDLSHEQYNVLRILRGSHPKCMCQKDILRRMIAPSCNITLIIKKLVTKQLVIVQQSQQDRREYVINISASGLQLLKDIEVAFRSRQLKIGGLTEAEAHSLNHLLDKLRS
jgi:DNA-binding MarR family transcriptional regulator